MTLAYDGFIGLIPFRNGGVDSMFQKSSQEGYRSAVKGIRMKTLVYGEKTLMTEFRLDGGIVLPGHSHPYEQTGYLVKGHIILSIGNEKYDVGPG